MGIYIKGIEKPPHCCACPLALANWCKKIPEKCLIVEVSEPHGRLVDLDAIPVPKFKNMADVLLLRKMVTDAPTVIEAEGE